MCSGALLPDVMHDLLEGTLQHVLQLLLAYCIDERKYFCIRTLNEKIKCMELGYMEDNCPSQLDHSKHLRQNSNILTHLQSVNYDIIIP